MKPYLQGFYLSENAWRENRDRLGYKVLNFGDPVPPELDAVDDDSDLIEEALLWGAFEEKPEMQGADTLPVSHVDEKQAPRLVYAVPRLLRDVQALGYMFEGDTPIQVIERPVCGSKCVVYGGGDASGEGFGSCTTPLGLPPLIRRGFWCSEVSEESSNYREFRNLLEAIREESRLERLTACEVWIATDNSTAELAFFKGRSSSKALDEMVLELRLIALKGNFVLRMVHISGTRMIRLGIDGLSRAKYHAGALCDAQEPGIIPLHLDPMARSPQIWPWLESWADGTLEIASPDDWFYRAQQGGEYTQPVHSKTWVWSLPPAAALHALEELGNGRLKRHDSLRGIVLVPALLRPEWFRRFRRAVDVYFFVPAGAIEAWPLSMHEPLTVGLYLPLLRHEPWDWRRVPFLVPFGRSLSALYKKGDTSGGSLLREFWEASSWIADMPERLVRDLLQNTSWRRFLNISADRRRGR